MAESFPQAATALITGKNDKILTSKCCWVNGQKQEFSVSAFVHAIFPNLRVFIAGVVRTEQGALEQVCVRAVWQRGGDQDADWCSGMI